MGARAAGFALSYDLWYTVTESSILWGAEMFGYVRNLWLTISLKKKLGAFSIIVILVMGLPISFNILVMNFSLNSFNVILNDNSLCYEVQEALEHEAAVFQEYVRDRSWEKAREYRLACFRTEESIRNLPFDHTSISSERYARTWNLKNGYEGYCEFRDHVASMNPEDANYVNLLYQVYDMQGYLQTYARRLMQATLKEGKSSYQQKAPVLYYIPYMIMAYSILMIITVICLTKLLANTLINPMVRLAHCSRKIARNDFSGKDVTVENKDEMGELVRAFNKMKHATERYINTLMEKNQMAERLHKEEMDRIEMEKRLDAARLELLKSQINPHFLFNTLNMIACMAKLEEADTTERMISSMSNLFRYNLKTSEQIVPLGQELKVVQDYMYIQQMRFGTRIVYESRLDVDEEETMIPAFTLQPIVENAIIHGLSKKEQGGRICLKVWRKDENVIISVADTGVGINEQRLEELRSALTERGTARIGIGLGNIYHRIQAMYHGGDFRIYSKEGKGTVVQVVIPQTEHMDSGLKTEHTDSGLKTEYMESGPQTAE